jgi:hypothetical protein
MFGKGKRSQSSTEKFIIGRGIDAGNLKGRGKADKTAPFAKGSPMGMPEGTLYTEKRAAKGPGLGKAGPVKITRG